MLTPAFRRHQVTYDVWQAADEVRRDELFQRFVGDNGRRAVAAPSVVTSADGITAVPVTPGQQGNQDSDRGHVQREPSLRVQRVVVVWM